MGSMKKNPVLKAIEIVGNQSALARQIGCTQGAVWKWLNKGAERVSAEYCHPIERATQGLVLCSDLRPDLFPGCPHQKTMNSQREEEEKKFSGDPE